MISGLSQGGINGAQTSHVVTNTIVVKAVVATVAEAAKDVEMMIPPPLIHVYLWLNGM
jgi:hypothetical protein